MSFTCWFGCYGRLEELRSVSCTELKLWISLGCPIGCSPSDPYRCIESTLRTASNLSSLGTTFNSHFSANIKAPLNSVNRRPG